MNLKNRRLWLAVLATAAVVAALAWAFSPRPVEVETAAIAKAHFEESIEEDGQTRVRERYTVSAPVAARLTRIALKEGDRVAAGDAVAVLRPVMSAMVDDRSRREAEARLSAATAGVQRAAAQVERARVTLEETRLQQRRTEQLANQGFVSPSGLDTARLARAAAERGLEVAQAEREVAQQERAHAAAALQPAANGAAGRPLTVTAPVGGVVLRVAQPSEATLPAGTALMDIGDPARMEVVSELLTTDAVRAQPGRKVVIERWGGPAVTGRVRRVEPAAFTKVSALGIEEQRVKVLIDLDATPPAWSAVGDGFRVGVRVITQSVDDAVVVPVGALFPAEDGAMAVFRVEGGRARLQPVEIGARNGSSAWVRTGLEPGMQVVVYPPPALADGDRVRIRNPR